ncbi:MAG: cobyric acid synthase [Parvibaculaceae bacterium]
MTARALMFQGTGSDVGKSLLVAGLCRVFHRRGLRVRPFKAQNMSNNAAVTPDGGEIGRAQALQAHACGVAPSVHMNPVLLKPQSETGAQIVVHGQVVSNINARDYQTRKRDLLPAVLESFARMKAESDLVLVEGAGSASEVNLRENDIANMGFARAAGVPVILIGDIERGGVIASLVGTQVVIDADDAALIAGFIVNKMRGDPTLFTDGMAFIESRTGWKNIGLVPYFTDAARLPAEDAMELTRWTRRSGGEKLRIAVPLTPRISNFDDLDPLRLEPDVDFIPVRAGQPMPDCDLVILPGSKVTIADLAFIREQGWDIDLTAHWRRGGYILGMCGGYQMLGQRISDPKGLEEAPANVEGLGLLDVETVLGDQKALHVVGGTSLADGASFSGYEMHLGETVGPDTARPFAQFSDGRSDGAISKDGRVVGTYVHGLFADDHQRASWLKRLGNIESTFRYEDDVERVLDALADHLERHVDVDALLKLAR